MSLPTFPPERSTSGIAIDPRTLDRVVPESRRPDGSVRKQLRIRPGFTPQEDVTRFRGTRQAQMDRNALPKGHILGWVAPSGASKPKKSEGVVSKSAKKNEKRKEKRDKQKVDIIRANWEDDDTVEDADEHKGESWNKKPEDDKWEKRGGSIGVEKQESEEEDANNEGSEVVGGKGGRSDGKSIEEGSDNRGMEKESALKHINRQFESLNVR